jgi:ERCC4-type nuclease
MHIQIDSREKAHAIEKILAEFDRQGVNHFVSKLYIADYMSLDNPRRVIDRKQNLSELYCNLCQDHKRFIAELLRAQAAGIELIILIEHGGSIKSIEDVQNWNNPRLKVSPYAWDGLRMYKTMLTVQSKYGVRFEFCSKAQTGRRIIEILKGEKNEIYSV